MKERLKYIDGIKGIACILVMAYHYHALFGYTFWGTDFLADKLDIVYNGAFYVRFFFVMSAFLLGVSFYRNVSVEKIKLTIVKRYLRLSLPVFGVSLLIWIMERIGCFYNTQIGSFVTDVDILNSFQTKHSILDIFTLPFIKTIFRGECSFNNNFWMMTCLFWGNLLVIGIILLTKSRNRMVKYIFALLILFSLILNDNYFPFIAGTILAYQYTSPSRTNVTEKGNIINSFLYFLLLFSGVVLVEAKGYIAILYNKLELSQFEELNFLANGNFYNVIAIFMITTAVIHLRLVQKILSFRLFTFLGNISYYVFLIHWPTICSLSCGLYLLFKDAANYATVVRGIFGITLLVVIIVSAFLQRTYEKGCEVLINYTVKRFDNDKL